MERIKISQLIDKSESRLKALEKSYTKKIEQLTSFMNIANDFDIKLSSVQRNIVGDKTNIYSIKRDTIEYFREWKYDHNCAGTLWSYHISGSSIELENKIRTQRLREIKINIVIKINKT